MGVGPGKDESTDLERREEGLIEAVGSRGGDVKRVLRSKMRCL